MAITRRLGLTVIVVNAKGNNPLPLEQRDENESVTLSIDGTRDDTLGFLIDAIEHDVSTSDVDDGLFVLKC